MRLRLLTKYQSLLFLFTANHLAFAQPPIPDTPFYQDYHEAFPLKTAAENDVRALAFDSAKRLWVATAAGLRYLENGRWKAPQDGDSLGPIYTLYSSGGQIWAGTWNGLFKISPSTVSQAGLHGAPISAISGRIVPGGDVWMQYAAGPHGIWRGYAGSWSPVRGSWNSAIRSILPDPNGWLWIGTASGLYIQEVFNRHPKAISLSKPNALLSSNINSLVRLSNGDFCVTSTGGLDFYRGMTRIRSLTAGDGMPSRQARAVAEDQDGRLWIATKLGVARYDHGKWSLRHSRRWLLSDDARDVKIGPDGTCWVATAGGVDAIRRRKMTLEEKADYFLRMLRARHIRPPGLIGPAVLEKPGDLSKSFIEDDDNDGEHTGMYCAMESMRYAETKAPDARENAKAAFHALMVLQQATGTPHFIARSVLPIGTAPRHEVDRTFTPEEIAESNRTEPREKIIEKRWIPTKDGKWLWKRDASSDEVDGHMFGYATYYDLAADDAEKKLVADQVDRIVSGIIDHGYLLQDIDGKGTRWGNWSPASLNHDPNWHEERAGNSVQMISYLGVAYHMTSNEKYRQAAKDLIERHDYAKNMLQTVFNTPSERTHIEDELLSIVYPNLANHLIFPGLKSTVQTSIRRWHESCRADGIPFYDFVFNRYSGSRVPLDRAVEVLRDWPLDMIEWTVDNRQREDITFDRTPGREEDFLTRILPRSEMGICMWDQEPYRDVLGRNGDREDKPTDWLLAYWMGRYYGLLGGPGN